MRQPDKMFIYFDCDDTLVMWNMQTHPKAIKFRHHRMDHQLVPHERHIKMLKEYYDRGYTVVVWSAGGRTWAQTVVRTLGLKPYVKHILAKPELYIDDLHCSEFMYPGRYYSLTETEEK